MPDTQISEEMEARARLALHNLVGLTRLDISAAEINEAVRAVLRAALSGHVVVPRGVLSRVVEIAHRNECDPETERLRAMIQAAPPVPVERG